MDLNSSDMQVQVLASGYASHTKPFHMKVEEGNGSYLFRLQTSGVSRASVGDRDYRIAAGDLLLVGPEDYYELSIEEELQPSGQREIASRDLFLFLQGEWIDDWWNAESRSSKVRIAGLEGSIELFRLIHQEKQIYAPESSQMLEWYVKILCVTIDRQISQSGSVNDRSHLAGRMRAYIVRHASSSFQLDDVARHAGISVSGAVRLFKLTYGKSIMQHALDVRLQMASERIRFTPMPLSHVSESSGFANYTYFHRAFKARFGMSPSDYRQSKQLRQPEHK